MNGTYRPLWLNNRGHLEVINQTKLPHLEEIAVLENAEDAVTAIADMIVRGAGVIGCVGAFGVYLAMREEEELSDAFYTKAKAIRDSRPTAVNLMWAVDRMVSFLEGAEGNLTEAALREAIAITDEEEYKSEQIAVYGGDIIEALSIRKEKATVNVLTHCNAGWLAVLDLGTALAPVYEAHRRGIDVHVWVDETRPRNQGANLTAWELAKEGIPHTVIADNTGGHLMQHGMVDLVITGADRVSRCGDVANKIGTYLKALAARDNNVPFFVALPSSTFDFDLCDGVSEIPIEERSEDEVKYMQGLNDEGRIESILVVPEGTRALNIGFDVTPARLVTGLITERGVCDASKEAIKAMFPEGHG